MRFASIALSLIVAIGFVAVGYSDEKKTEKEVTLEGTITCPKCDLGIAKQCATVVKVKGKNGKETIYWFNADSNKKYHGEICTEAKAGKVTGKVSKDGDKMIIAVSKVAFK